ncbi:MAG: hypothetical protein ACYSRR_08140, partial [Planctomycetota bacterium]
MDNRVEQIKNIIVKAERELQEVIAESARDGDYRSVDIARIAAANLREFSAHVSEPTLNKKNNNSVQKTEAKVKTKKRKKTFAKKQYPKFELRKDSLVKIGWSKKQRREYTHKVPATVFNHVVKTMIDMAKGAAGPFMAEDIIEKLNSQLSEIIPSYQVYIVIGLLKQSNCVKQIGREGYHIP